MNQEEQSEILREIRLLRSDVDRRLTNLEKLASSHDRAIESHSHTIAENTENIHQIYQILQEIKQNQGVPMNGGTAVPKEPFYQEVESHKITRRDALRALRNSGTIRLSAGTATFPVRIGGQVQRVIFVIEEDKPCKM